MKKDSETKEKFVELRASGLSFAKIAEELGVSKQTLISWSQQTETKLIISNLKAIELEALQEKYLIGKRQRIKLFGEKLQIMLTELEQRDLSDIPTDKLFLLIERYSNLLRDEYEPVTFSKIDDFQSDHITSDHAP